MSSLLRHTIAKIIRLSATPSLLVAMAMMPAKATVLEYGKTGDVTVTETQAIENRKSETIDRAPSASGSKALRELTRDVAVQFSGAPGVRQSGLDALTFIEVFELLIERESAFRPKAISEKGAIGLGQLMPDTAKDMGVKDPLDPHQNLIGSAKYFTMQLKRFEKLELALAAYNAGPERVKQYGGIPPFKETQTYVEWILARAGLDKNEQPASNSAATLILKKSKEAPLKGEVSVWEF